jgi:hypothetical protein
LAGLSAGLPSAGLSAAAALLPAGLTGLTGLPGLAAGAARVAAAALLAHPFFFFLLLLTAAGGAASLLLSTSLSASRAALTAGLSAAALSTLFLAFVATGLPAAGVRILGHVSKSSPSSALRC